MATSYLRQNRGRYFVRVRVPQDLQPRFGKAQEKYLNTADLREAKRRAPIAVAEIMSRLERARLGRLSAQEMADIGHAELQKTHNFLSADPFNGPGALSDYLFVVQDSDRESLDYEELRPKAINIIERIGADVTDESIRQVSDAMVSAAFTAQELWRRNIAPPAQTVSPVLSNKDSAGHGGMIVSEAMESYLFETKVKAKTEHEWRRTVRRWQELHGDTPIRTITKEQVSLFKNALLRCPARPPHKIREMPILRMIEVADGKYGTISAKTVNKGIGAINAMLEWAVKNGRLDINPASGVKAAVPRKKSDEKRRPFTVPELQMVLAGATGEKRKGDRWLPFVAAFTGARESELATARVADIQTEEGITFIRITDAGEGRSIKNDESLRDVPLHPTLIELGFLGYVKKLNRDGLLFPDSCNAAAYSKRFGRLLDKLGLSDPTLVFHSFRHTFKDACRDSGLYEEMHDELTGHAGPEGKNKNAGRDYGKGFSLHALNEAMQKIRWRGLDLSNIKI